MSDRDARFRRLAPTGDLFAHFGVELEPPPPPVVARSGPKPATSCGHCGWFVDASASACPVCAMGRAGAR